MMFNRSSRILSQLGALFAISQIGLDPRSATITAKAWAHIRSTIRIARGKRYGKHANPADFPIDSAARANVQAAADKRARRAIDASGMRVAL